MKQITTERLVIRSVQPDDWKDLYEILSDESVVRFEPYDVSTEEQCKLEAAQRSMQDFVHAVCLKDSGKLIGNVFFREQSEEEYQTWELGYVFNANYQGMGYAMESCSAILKYGFEDLQARHVIAVCDVLNSASWELLEHLHFRREGCFLQNVFFKRDCLGNPIWRDTYVYALLKDEWQKLYK